MLVARAVYLQALNNDFLQQKGEPRYCARDRDARPRAARIVDRNGEPLAISTPVESVWAMPGRRRADAGAAAQLWRSVLEHATCASSTQTLADRTREFVYLKRQIPPEHGGAGGGAQHPGRAPAARVPPLLPGGRGGGARGRLHRRRRHRPGGHRARLSGRGSPASRAAGG
ncbi:MAG: hypothetical protein MZW92_01370 [Comamonadaceae bacterium]|nr:hypothetical protein [Comamonadaceae bacterium]